MTTGPEPFRLRAPVGLKTLRRLARRRSTREETGCFVVEGERNVADALDAGVSLIEVFAEPAADAAVVAAVHDAGVDLTRVDTGRLDGVVSTRTPQPLAGVAVAHTVDLSEIDPGSAPLVLVLVDVGDPGNVGTLMRVAGAAGAGAVLCLGNTADPFNPKSVRASAGSVFRVDLVIEREASSTMQALGEAGWITTATSPHAEMAHDRCDLVSPTALVLGSEPHGLDDSLLAAVDRTVTIPMEGPVESLNVAMAGAVLCFESLRQRRIAKEAESST